MSNGVMAAQQILVLFVQVRILVGQQNNNQNVDTTQGSFSLVGIK